MSQLDGRARSALLALLLAAVSLGAADWLGWETAAAAPRSECVLGDPSFDKLVEEIGIGPAREQCKQQAEREAAAKAAAAAEEEAALAPPPKPPETSAVQSQIDEIVARNEYKFVYGGSTFMRNCLQGMVYTSYLGLGSPTLPNGAEAACMKSVEQANLVHAQYQPDYDPTFEARQREEALAKQKLLEEEEELKHKQDEEEEKRKKREREEEEEKKKKDDQKSNATKHGTDNKSSSGST
jgi:hypothetical protein